MSFWKKKLFLNIFISLSNKYSVYRIRNQHCSILSVYCFSSLFNQNSLKIKSERKKWLRICLLKPKCSLEKWWFWWDHVWKDFSGLRVQRWEAPSWPALERQRWSFCSAWWENRFKSESTTSPSTGMKNMCQFYNDECGEQLSNFFFSFKILLFYSKSPIDNNG